MLLKECALKRAQRILMSACLVAITGVTSWGTSIVDQPASVSAAVSTPATIKVSATGSGLKYQWFRNGMQVSGATQSSMGFTSLKFGDQGTYWVEVTDRNGDRKVSEPAVVVVAKPGGGSYNMCNWIPSANNKDVPVIHPETEEGLVNTDWLGQVYMGVNEFEMTPTGPAMSFYGENFAGHFLKDPSPGRSSDKYSPGQTVKVQYRVWKTGTGATFESALENDSDYFASNIFDLKLGGVGNPPSLPSNFDGLDKFYFNDGLPYTGIEIVSEPSHVNLPEGAAAEIAIEAKGRELTYSWTFNGSPIDDEAGPSISFGSLAADDQGTYQVKVADAEGNEYISEPVIVLASPSQGGTISFCNLNIGPDLKLVPVVHPENGPVSGSDWLAQPFVGTDQYKLQPIGPATPFFTGNGAGFMLKTPTPSRRIPFISPGQQAVIQVRVWQSGLGLTFESALENGSDFFASNIFDVQTGGVGTPPSLPTELLGLNEFLFNDGLPPEKAEILEDPKGGLFAVGNPVILNVTAEGKDISYMWYLNGSALDNTDSPTLDLGSARPEIQGTYHVVVSDSLGNSVSSDIAIVVVSTGAFGSIDICNWNLDENQRGVPVVHPETQKGITGYRWLSQLFAGSSKYDLVPSGPAVPFYGEEFPGFWRKEPSSVRQIDGMAPGSVATIQFRVWQTEKGTSFEEAMEAGSDFFASNIFETRTGGVGSPPSLPAKVTGLQEFFFNDGLPALEAQIASHSDSQTIPAGEDTTLSVDAQGSGLTFQWFLNGIAIDGANEAELDIDDSTPANEGTYEVVVSDEFGNSVTSEPIVLAVWPATGATFNFCNVGIGSEQRNILVTHPDGDVPLSGTEWLAQPFAGTNMYDMQPAGPATPFYSGNAAGVILKEPSPARIAANIEAGASAIFQIRVWKAGLGHTFDEALENGSDFFASNIFENATGGSGTPPSVPADLDGLTEFHFNDGLPPDQARILSQPQHVNALVGDPISVEVIAEGPGLTFEWFKNGWALPDTNTPVLSSDSASLDDQGTFEVEVTDENGFSVRSTQAVVLVNSQSGGTFNVCNLNLEPNARAVPVVHPETIEFLAGAGWMAQPFVGTNPYNLEPVGPAVPFYEGRLRGFYLKEPTPARTIPGIAPGEMATVQIRVWETSAGPDFDSAYDNKGNFFASNIFEVKTGGVGSPPSLPADLDGLLEFFYNDGLPKASVVWGSIDEIVYGTALGDNQLNAESLAPGSFEYIPASGTVLNAGRHELKVIFTPEDPDADVIELTNAITVIKATPTFTGAPLSNWPTETPIQPLLVESMIFDVAGAKSLNLTNGSPVEYGVTLLHPGANRMNLTFTPADSANYNPVSHTFFVEGLKEKEKQVKPEKTDVSKDKITIELPVEKNTYYQIEFSEDLINWVVVFVSDDDTSPDFQAALSESQENGFYRIRSFTVVTPPTP